MSRDVGEVIELVLSWALTTALLFAVVLVDERFMSEERKERAWPRSSRDAAIVGFGLLALPVHFAKTLGHFRSVVGVLAIFGGLLLGVLLDGVVLAAASLVLYVVGRLLGLPD